MKLRKVLVTVGTTKFPKLIDTITTQEVIDILMSLGFKEIQLQTGFEFTGVRIDPSISIPHTIREENNSFIVELGNKMILKYNAYFNDDFEEHILCSDLIISHAGAGSCLEVLLKKKPLIVVVNDDLMDNHQLELASELEKRGFVYSGTCDTLKDLLKKDFSKLETYPQPERAVFPSYLDNCMGYA